MSTVIDDPVKQSAASLVSGILGDLQHLVEQQFQLTRREVEEELGKRADAVALMSVGVGIVFLGAIVMSLMLVHLLYWSASPPGSDPAWLPLWACHAGVAAVLFIVGGILAIVGRERFRAIDPYQNPATELLQEHVP